MKSFLEGRAVIAKEPSAAPSRSSIVNNVLPSLGRPAAEAELPAALRGAEAGLGQSRHGQAKVEAIEEQGVIRRIIVTCFCGERVEVHCGY